MSRRVVVDDLAHAGPKSWRPVNYPAPVYACRNIHIGPHHRCRHATPAPVGYVRCAGDPACPILLSPYHQRVGIEVCPWHRDLATAATADELRRRWGIDILRREDAT